jgi:hypothetical protein
MSKQRLEAFSDGVIAILITIMVLELRTPHGTTWAALREGLLALLAYVLSFVNIGSSARSSRAITTPMAPAPFALHQAGRSRRCRVWRSAPVAREAKGDGVRSGSLPSTASSSSSPPRSSREASATAMPTVRRTSAGPALHRATSLLQSARLQKKRRQVLVLEHREPRHGPADRTSGVDRAGAAARLRHRVMAD